jgi:peptide chain release factor 2
MRIRFVKPTASPQNVEKMAPKDTANIVYELNRQLTTLDETVNGLAAAIDVPKKQQRLAAIEEEMADPAIWSDQAKASALQKEKSQVVREVDGITTAQASVADYVELLSLVKDDDAALADLVKDTEELSRVVKNLQMERLLAKEHDQSNAIVSINVGQGGVDSQDFTQILFRMYKRYAERRGYEVTLMDLQPGEEAGYKSVTFEVTGPYAYGYLKAEIGVHRLVRISPFDSSARRHTSFASVWVMPEIDDSITVDIKPDDLRVDTFRSGGAGGQHVNKTDSAVRLTHLPTNTVVVCQAERSQIKNRATAMKILKSRLHELEMRNRLAEKDKAEAQKLEASFGSQIRNYVMAPYRLVKDLRTGFEVGNVDAVLDGDIQPFIESYLLSQS